MVNGAPPDIDGLSCHLAELHAILAQSIPLPLGQDHVTTADPAPQAGRRARHRGGLLLGRLDRLLVDTGLTRLGFRMKLRVQSARQCRYQEHPPGKMFRHGPFHREGEDTTF